MEKCSELLWLSVITSKYDMILYDRVGCLQISSMIEIEVEMDSDVLAAEAATNAVGIDKNNFFTVSCLCS